MTHPPSPCHGSPQRRRRPDAQETDPGHGSDERRSAGFVPSDPRRDILLPGRPLPRPRTPRCGRPAP
jgi:hypothetical protein